MRLFLRDGSSHLQILSPSFVREFRDVGAAKEFLRPLLSDVGNAVTVQRAIGSDDDLVEQLALRIVSEGLQIVSCSERRGGAVTVAAQGETTTTPLQDEQAKEKPAEPPPKHFIEIELVDDDGKPVPNEAYLIELPDGTKRTGRTDGGGKARITGVEPGTAKVSFPDLDKTAYEPDSGG
jgi:hypothetical protein